MVGGGSVAEVGAAAGPGDVEVNIQDGPIAIAAVGFFCTALFMDVHKVGTELWGKKRSLI